MLFVGLYIFCKYNDTCVFKYFTIFLNETSTFLHRLNIFIMLCEKIDLYKM